MRTVRAVAALIAIASLIVGVPIALWVFGSPRALMSIHWSTLLTTPADSGIILALLSLVGWVAWAVLAATVVAEGITVLSRQRIRVRVPGTAWLRPVAAALVSAAFAIPTVAHAAPAPPAAPDAPAPISVAQGPSAPAAPEVSRTYLVQSGDELWDVAERELGSGELWRTIASLNPDIPDSLRLIPGQVLALPVDQLAERVDDSTVPVVVVERGDSLWAVSERLLGDGQRWPELAATNPELISDPDQIDVGWKLTLPAEVSGVEEPGIAAVTPPSTPEPADPTPTSSPPAHQVATPPVAQTASPTPTASPTGIGQAPPSAPPSASPAAGASQTPSPALSPTELASVSAQPTRPGDRPPDAGDATVHPVAVLGPMSAVVALAVVGTVTTRRRSQLLSRDIGARVPPIPPRVSRFWAAVAKQSAGAPSLTREGPTSVLLGWHDKGELWHDLEQQRSTVFVGPEASAGVASVLTSLSSAPWSNAVEVFVVGRDAWASAVDDPRIISIDTAQEGLTSLTRRCSQRRVELRDATLAQRRADPDQAEAWHPVVFVFETPLDATQSQLVSEALSLGEVGVSVVSIQDEAPPDVQPVQLGPTEGRFRATQFVPQLIREPARRALIELLRATGSPETTPAPWWCDGSPSSVLPLPLVGPDAEERPVTEPPEHPMLLLLGEVELLAPAGQRPSRALSQCMEYCAWLLSHPGATPTVMVRDLLVAETTRRSNMSRLRTWLGQAADEAAYLPDAYSGRIRLDPRVTSDWEQFEALLGGGVNLASSSALRQALRLVRGEPLGSLSFQWHWAETMRADMVAMITDAACVLADRALAHEDAHLALWAVGRGRLAAPGDDHLRVRAIHALAIAGRSAEMSQAIVELTRSTRAAGRDLDLALAKRVQVAIQLCESGQPLPSDKAAAQ